MVDVEVVFDDVGVVSDKKLLCVVIDEELGALVDEGKSQPCTGMPTT